jgi:hypothetical protein
MDILSISLYVGIIWPIFGTQLIKCFVIAPFAGVWTFITAMLYAGKELYALFLYCRTAPFSADLLMKKEYEHLNEIVDVYVVVLSVLNQITHMVWSRASNGNGNGKGTGNGNDTGNNGAGAGKMPS